jgi:RNA polymerase sigma-70 factor (sigma-E family)
VGPVGARARRRVSEKIWARGKESAGLRRNWAVERNRLEFAQFYAAARDDCLRVVLVRVGDRQLADDLVAEAFARAWVAWRSVRRHPSPRAWVVRTALNTHVSWWRRRRHEVALGHHDPVAEAGSPATVGGPLGAALRALPARQREVVTLRVLLDLDTDTTARILGIAPGTVGAHLHRAIAALRSELPINIQEGSS